MIVDWAPRKTHLATKTWLRLACYGSYVEEPPTRKWWEKRTLPPATAENLVTKRGITLLGERRDRHATLMVCRRSQLIRSLISLALKSALVGEEGVLLRRFPFSAVCYGPNVRYLSTTTVRPFMIHMSARSVGPPVAPTRLD